MKHDLGTFPGSAASRQTRTPDITASRFIWLAAITIAIIIGWAAQVAPAVV
ncbi:hypothetical protein SAMN05892877_117113 [Rhizobium subbaraonis]|uniref:Uncharacterized protein n=1 Tax=Rhizobium subbaraonis TaxID=908946 RepID=A0A285UV10_9HYPH|nr:hypothetical protein [Rhizobium subbaraonis]SOC45724.1 hypothetical protein SAMN05892877_117113 [Rhizobium subbaraonis]